MERTSYFACTRLVNDPNFYLCTYSKSSSSCYHSLAQSFDFLLKRFQNAKNKIFFVIWLKNRISILYLFFSFSVGGLSTDLQCYFGCDESFKKDYQLHLHLKLKHRNEDPEELAKAYEAAEEEIALTRRSASIFNCALCPKTFNDNGAFYGHIQV